MKLEIHGLKTKERFFEGINLAELIVEEAEKQANGIKNGDVVVITSKIVSKVEGRIFKISEIKPSLKAKLLSKFFRKDPRIVELLIENTRIKFPIPIFKLAKKYGRFFEGYCIDRGVALKLIEADPYVFMCELNGLLLTDGGLDFSNAPKGFCTLPPEDPDKSARRIREEIEKITHKKIAVIIADTEWKLDKFGTVDVAIGCSGLNPVSRKFGEKDLYGKPKFGGIDNLADLFAACANLTFGQTKESIPIAIIRNAKWEKGEIGIKDIAFWKKEYRIPLSVLLEALKFKFLSKLSGI